MHENCAYSVDNYYICCNGKRIANTCDGIAMIADLESGVLLKVGQVDVLVNYLSVMRESYNKIGLPMIANNIILVVYDETSDLSPDDICTIINWFSNSIGDKMKEFLELDYKETLKEIKRLQELGF